MLKIITVHPTAGQSFNNNNSQNFSSFERSPEPTLVLPLLYMRACGETSVLLAVSFHTDILHLMTVPQLVGGKGLVWGICEKNISRSNGRKIANWKRDSHLLQRCLRHESVFLPTLQVNLGNILTLVVHRLVLLQAFLVRLHVLFTGGEVIEREDAVYRRLGLLL